MNLGLSVSKSHTLTYLRNLEFVLRWQISDTIKAKVDEDYSRCKGRFLQSQCSLGTRIAQPDGNPGS